MHDGGLMEDFKIAYTLLNSKFVQAAAQLQLKEGEIQSLKDKIKFTEGRVRKEEMRADSLYGLLISFCNGEKTLEDLKKVLRNFGPRLKIK